MMGRTRHRSPGLTAFPGALAVHPSTVRTRRMGAGAMRKIGRSRRELSPLICCLPDRPRRIEPGTVCIIGAMVPISPAIDCMRGATAREICRSRHFGGSSSPASRRHVPKRPGLSCRQRRHSTKRRSCRFRPRSIALGGDRPRNLRKPPFWRVFLTCLATHVPKRRELSFRRRRQPMKRRSCCFRLRSIACRRRAPGRSVASARCLRPARAWWSRCCRWRWYCS